MSLSLLFTFLYTYNMIKKIGKIIISFGAILLLGSLIWGLVSVTSQKQLNSVNKNFNQKILKASDIKNVTLEANKTDSSLTDIVAHLVSGKTQIIASSGTLYRGHYHPIEYSDGDIYVIKRIGNPSNQSNWTDELWKIHFDGTESRIFISAGLDFRVAPNKKNIAIQTLSQDSNHLLMINEKGDTLKDFSLSDLAIDSTARSIEMFGWSSDSLTFWGDVFFAEKENVYQISSDSWNVKKFEFLGLHTHDLAMNADLGSLVYSDYPAFVDASEAQQYELSGEKTHLFLINFHSGIVTTIDTGITKMFQPKWLSNNTIQYTDPVKAGLKTYHLK